MIGSSICQEYKVFLLNRDTCFREIEQINILETITSKK